MGIKTTIKNIFNRKVITPEVVEQRSDLSGMPVNYSAFQTLMNQWAGMYQNKSKIQVTPETSLTLSAFYSCVRNIAEDIAKLPYKPYLNKNDGNRYPVYNHPSYKLLQLTPNDISTPFTLVETLLKSALIRGNGYAYIERDPITADPVAMYWLRDEIVTPILSKRKLFYIVHDVQLEINGVFPATDIFHLRGMGDGYIGKSVIGYASESIGKAIATQQFGGKFFGSDGINMIMQFIGIKDENKLKQAKEGVMRSYELDGVAATNGEVKIEKIAVPNDQSQFVQSQDFNVADIARWFRMPLSKLQKDSNTGTEQEAINYVNDCLYPWVVRLQQEIETKLFRESEKFVMDARFSFDALLKGDSAAQERRIKTMFMTSAWSPNDVRKFMDYNTVPLPHMDEKYVPVNMIPGTQINEFWKGKQADQSQLDTTSPDSSGSGNVNANVNAK